MYEFFIIGNLICACFGVKFGNYEFALFNFGIFLFMLKGYNK